MVGGLGEREQLLVSAWLTGLRLARTRRTHAADVVAWLGWLAGRETGALAAGRLYVDLWAATQVDGGRQPPNLPGHCPACAFIMSASSRASTSETSDCVATSNRASTYGPRHQ